MAYDEGFTEQPYEGAIELTLNVKIPLDIAEWLKKVAELGLTRKLVVNTLLRDLMNRGIQDFLVESMTKKARDLSLVGAPAETSPDEGGDAE
jgi:hypothetical protein